MELIILLVVIVLFFGSKRIPSLARSLGSGIKEFRKGASGLYEELEQGDEECPVGEEADSEADEANALTAGPGT
jgi:TatA/E family protein of Tat protein translocase